MMSDQLLSTLKKLRLSGLAESLEIRLHEAATSGLNHREFLELLIQDELLIRNQRQINRRTMAANFREVRRLEDFDFGFNPSIKKDRVFDRASGNRQEPFGAGDRPGSDSLRLHSLLSIDLRHRAGLSARRSAGRPGTNPAAVPQAGPADHRRHGNEAIAQTVRRIPVRNRAQAPRAQIDHDDQQSSP